MREPIPPPVPKVRTIQWFGNEVTKRTNGRVTFRYAWAGAMTKGPQTLDSVKSGLSGIVNVPVALYADKLPLTNFSNAIPFSMEGAEKKYPIFQKLFQEFPHFNNEWAAEGTRPLVITLSPSVQLQSTVPIRTVEDLKGKKIALIGRYAPKWLAATGAVPINTIMADRTAQLQTGMLQGSILSTTLASSFGYEEYAKYLVKIDLGTWIGSLHRDESKPVRFPAPGHQDHDRSGRHRNGRQTGKAGRPSMPGIRRQDKIQRRRHQCLP